MSSYGGGTQYGASQYGGDVLGFNPAYAIDRALVLLRQIRKDAGGPFEQVDVFEGPLGSEPMFDTLRAAGSPAAFVGYQGGRFQESAMTSGDEFMQSVELFVIVTASSYLGRRYRLDGGMNIYEPGVWNLTRWAAHYAGRAWRDVQDLHGLRPVRERYLKIPRAYHVGVVEFSATACFDIFDDRTGLEELRYLGIVHTPSDLDQLFDVDNVTPNTEDPTSPGPGVADLELPS